MLSNDVLARGVRTLQKYTIHMGLKLRYLYGIYSPYFRIGLMRFGLACSRMHSGLMSLSLISLYMRQLWILRQGVLSV
jgi:hypothetical protein